MASPGMRGAWLLLLPLVLTGCLGAPTPATPAPPSSQASPCLAPGGAVFLSTISGGGFVPQDAVPRMVDVTPDGRIRIVQAHAQAGSGRIVEDPPGAMRGITEATVRAMAARHNVSLEGRDLVVTQGVEAPLAKADFDALCAHVVAAFPSLKREYPNDQGCADEGSTTWNISIRQGSRTVFADQCASDTGAFGPLAKELGALEQKATSLSS